MKYYRTYFNSERALNIDRAKELSILLGSLSIGGTLDRLPVQLREVVQRSPLVPAEVFSCFQSNSIPFLEMGKSTEEKLLEYIKEGEVLKVKSYLKKHALLDLNRIRHRDQMLRTPLHIACAAGHEQIVRLLMRLGASSEVQDSMGDTPLHLALRRVLHGDEYGK